MQSQSRTVNSIRNIATGFIGQFIQTILGFISRTVFIKFLAAEYLGVSGLFSNILSMLSLAELGVGTAIIYALYKPLAERDKKEISVLMGFYARAYKTIGIVIAIIGVVLMPLLNVIIKDAPNIKENLYVLYCFYLFNTVVSYFYSYKNSIIVADQKNYISAIISYLISIVQTILQIIVLVVTRNFLVYLAVQTIGTLSFNIIISKMADKLYPFLKENNDISIDKEKKSALIKNIRALMIVKLSGVLVNNTDNMIITYFSGLATVGLSSNYTMLIGIINTVLNQIFNGITASVGNLNAKESKERQREFFYIINFANFWIYGFCSICIIILINDVINIWIGSKFILPLNIAIILAINFYMVGMQNVVWTFKNTMGLFRKGRYILIITAILNLTLSMILGNFFGLFGILLATAISRILTNVWYDPYAVYRYGLECKSKEYFKRYIEFLIILILNLLITRLVCNFIIVNNIWTLLFKILICTVISNILFIILLCKKKEFMYFKNFIINILRSILNKDIIKNNNIM
ncbi:sugar translocase [Clostridium sp. D53t1_180928_C8]|uniref:lipopolysaccharide biosynthesis protein n=1 Tax=Clostridium sp. D53t1_180928_C8 TaxID=2787101 RepID=UPI0018ABC270|nr:sugar translocase [Clostridium sp. D53t1_180928_C8]